jgi:hypothetical protein
MDKVIAGLKELWLILFKGAFAMLPGVFFIGVVTFLLALIDAEAASNVWIWLFGGACGGCWLTKKMILNSIEKMSDQSSKLEIYKKIANS